MVQHFMADDLYGMYNKSQVNTAIRRIAITDLEPNIENILVLTTYNGIRTHPSQHTIRIHWHVSNLTLVISDVWY